MKRGAWLHGSKLSGQFNDKGSLSEEFLKGCFDLSVTYRLSKYAPDIWTGKSCHKLNFLNAGWCGSIQRWLLWLWMRDRETLCWIILLYSLNDGWPVGTLEDLQLIIAGEDEIINTILCNKFFKWECMFYLQYRPILGFKAMNKNKYFFIFLSNRQEKRGSIAFLSLPAKEDMHSELQRGRQTQALLARRINGLILLCTERFKP